LDINAFCGSYEFLRRAEKPLDLSLRNLCVLSDKSKTLRAAKILRAGQFPAPLKN